VTREVVIGGRRVGAGHPPLVIAELSGNHNQSLERALALVDAAANAGAHAVKLQTYTADTMTLDLRAGDFYIEDPQSPWRGKTLHELYRQAHTPWEWHAPIFERCRARGLIAFSTPFDASAVDFLEQLGVPAYKIASFELTDLALIQRAARTGKPLLMSTGMATLDELDDAVRAVRSVSQVGLVLLRCTSAYPATADAANLRTIPHLRELFDVPVGISDHTPGVGVATAAVALGAVLVEKHFTLRRADGGVDAEFSLEPAELASLVTETERAFRALGEVHYGPTVAERGSLRFRRSLYVTRAGKTGEPLTLENVRAIRPAGGLKPKHLASVLGRNAARDLEPGTPLAWELISPRSDEVASFENPLPGDS